MAISHLRASAVVLLGALVSSASVLAQQPAAPSPAPEQHQARPAPKGRVFVWDIEGTWLSQAYMQQLQATRSPYVAGSRTPALMIKVRREERSYPILITDFHKATMQFLIEVEPAGKPDAYRMVVAPEDAMVSSTDITYVPFRGQKNPQSKFATLAIADPFLAKGKYLTFERLPDGLPDGLEVYVNQVVIAGKYQDREGRAYEFTPAGDAVFPDRSFPYEVNLDAKAGNCDLLHSHRERAADGKERLGFAWKGGELQLLKIKALKGERYACAGKPFAILTAQSKP